MKNKEGREGKKAYFEIIHDKKKNQPTNNSFYNTIKAVLKQDSTKGVV